MNRMETYFDDLFMRRTSSSVHLIDMKGDQTPKPSAPQSQPQANVFVTPQLFLFAFGTQVDRPLVQSLLT